MRPKTYTLSAVAGVTQKEEIASTLRNHNTRRTGAVKFRL